MYNNAYEEYIRNSLGYNNINTMMNINNSIYYEDENNFTYNSQNIDNMYPEIYKIIYPMVCKECMNIKENISEELINRITNDIYDNLENIEVKSETRNNNTKDNKISSFSNIRQENRTKNFLLSDLIRILVLRELFGNPIKNNNSYFQGNIRTPYIF